MTRDRDAQNPVVSCQWLAEHLEDPQVRVIEVSSSADDTAYREGHLPGAVWWFWKDALWHPSDREFANPTQLAQRLGRIGVTPQTTVVLYGIPVQYGTYAFWALLMAGHSNVKLLDGGRQRWVLEGRPLSQEVPSFAPATYSPGTADDTSRIGRDEVRARLGQPEQLLLDVRSPEEYLGERVSPPAADAQFDLDHGAERKGRIPGARHLFFRELLNEDDTFRAPEELQAILEQVGGLPSDGTEVVTYCRLSHRATIAWFALRYLLGLERVRVYDGSWTEWGSIVGFPVEAD